MKTIGIQMEIDESWKGRFVKFLLFLNILSASANMLIRGYYMVFTVKDVYELAECVTTYISVCDFLVKIVNFYVQQNLLNDLMKSLIEFMKIGTIQTSFN